VAALGPLPGNLRVEPWVNPAEVLPRADVAVSHGGFGTTMEAIATGLPLVMVPLFGDQPDNAARIEAAGAGVIVWPSGPEEAIRSSIDPAALRAAIETALTEPAYREVPALEDFRPMPIFALVRFGKWSEILAEPRPADDLQYTTGIWHWARGLAYLRQGDLIAAEREYEQVAAISKTDAMRELSLASFPKAATLLEIATHVLGGEIESARGNTDGAITRFELAVALQDGLAYIEPPAWFYPVRHNLGAVLLAAGRPADAESVYQEDLRQYPNNGWSLLGLSQSLEAQGKAAEAGAAQQRFAESWQQADVMPTASRF
jgi:tetratricopeptide (TPR) repeat protein